MFHYSNNGYKVLGVVIETLLGKCLAEILRDQLILRGEVPNPIDVPDGCRFHPRCPIMTEECKRHDFPEMQITPRHKAACLRI